MKKSMPLAEAVDAVVEAIKDPVAIALRDKRARAKWLGDLA